MTREGKCLIARVLRPLARSAIPATPAKTTTYCCRMCLWPYTSWMNGAGETPRAVSATVRQARQATQAALPLSLSPCFHLPPRSMPSPIFKLPCPVCDAHRARPSSQRQRLGRVDIKHGRAAESVYKYLAKPHVLCQGARVGRHGGGIGQFQTASVSKPPGFRNRMTGAALYQNIRCNGPDHQPET